MTRKQLIAQRRRAREELEFRRQEALARNWDDNYNKARVAHHEMGHSALLWFQRHAGVFISASVVRNPNDVNDLGRTRSSIPRQMTRAQMKALLAVQLGGQVAELRAFDRSVGHGNGTAGDDEHNWTRTARALVRSSHAYRVLAPELQEAHLGPAMETAIAQAHNRARLIHIANEKKLRLMAQLLFRKNSLNAGEFRRLMGQPPASEEGGEEEEAGGGAEDDEDEIVPEEEGDEEEDEEEETGSRFDENGSVVGADEVDEEWDEVEME
uniref:Peptidase_M41 domain-containing protein n=1 Tax=Globodera pallida TaxID=36090 RepID=A0A183BZU7_GLOPA